MPKEKKKTLVVITFFFLAVLLLVLISSTQTYLSENGNWDLNLTKIQLGALSWGDIDNNGYQDIVSMGVCGANCYSSKVYLNNGTSLIESPQWGGNLTSLSYGSISLGDINNDGKLDLVLSGCSSGVDEFIDICNAGAIRTLIYLNNGSSFIESPQWEQNLTKGYRGALSLGDINNDGKLDLALNGETESSLTSKVYINNGTSFVESQQWQNNLTALRKSSLVFGDMDNDGNLDLILSGQDNSFSKLTKVYINNRTDFVESSQWSQNLASVEDSSLALADFNNDGNLDLSLTGCCDLHRIYKNNGSRFVEINREITGGLAGVFIGSQAFGDYNADGYLDLITNGREQYTTLYLYNISSTNFTSYSQDPESDIINLDYGSLTWIDLDNDLDLDLIQTGYGSEGGGSGNATMKAFVYLNNRSLTKNNTLPSPPTSLFLSSYSTTNNQLTLSWGNGSDAETNISGLYYNLMVGNSTNNHTIVSGVYGGSSNPTAGYFGNMMQRKNITLNLVLAEGTYYWYVQTIDTGLAKSDWSARQSFIVSSDTTSPSISSISSSVTSSTATITWTTDEMANSTVYYGTTNSTTSKSSSSELTISHSITLNGLSASTLYYYNVSSCDDSGNCNTSSQYSFTTSDVPVTPPPTGGGGGGSGSPTSAFWTKTEIISNENFSTGFEKELSSKERIKINVSGEEHYIGIISVDNNLKKATINISSSPIQVILGIGEEAKVDVSSDGWYDVYFKLISILNNKANLTIKAIHEEILKGKGNIETSGEIVNGNDNEKEKAKLLVFFLAIVVGAIILIFAGIFIYLLIRRRKRK